MLIRNSDYEPVFLIPVDGKPAGLEQESIENCWCVVL